MASRQTTPRHLITVDQLQRHVEGREPTLTARIIGETVPDPDPSRPSIVAAVQVGTRCSHS